jgi:hypothetical protein
MLRKLVFILLLMLSVGLFLPAVAAPQSVYVVRFRLDGYPSIARQANVAGDVSVNVHLNADGSVSSLSDVKGPDLLRGEAELVRTWQFVVTDGKAKVLPIILRYTLRGEGRREASTLIIASLPQMVEITTNPTADMPIVRRGRPNPEIPKSNTCYRCGPQ